MTKPTQEDYLWLFDRVMELTDQLERDVVARGFTGEHLCASQIVEVFALTANCKSPEMAYHAALAATVRLAKRSGHDVAEAGGNTLFAACGRKVQHFKHTPAPEDLS